MKRREFFKKAAVAAGATALGTSVADAGTTSQPIDNRKVGNIAFPEKRPLSHFQTDHRYLKHPERCLPVL